MKKALILTILLSIVSCKGQKKESKELVKKANTFFWESKLDKKVKVDSCLVLINQAIEIDDENFGAYEAKSTFLAYKKDIKGLLKNNEKMIELHPKQPYWKIHRGLYLELSGEKVEAEKYYDQAILDYQNLFLEPNQNNEFNLRMEYLTALEAKGDLKKAEIELKKMSVDFPDNETLKVYKTEYKFKTKKELFEIWEKGTDE
jgi:tetratricopeptide (TPR) repeat protein